MHGLNGPESKTACMFRRVRQVAAPGGGKSAVSDCILFMISIIRVTKLEVEGYLFSAS